MRVLHIDFEGGSAADLPLVGVHKYARHWTTHVYCMAYRFDNEASKIWYMWEPFPQEVADHVEAGGVVVAHNASFERTLWNTVLRRPNRVDGLPALKLPVLRTRQMVCTMARASALSLPAGLDYIAQVMGFEFRKDAVGGKLMMKYARPASTITNEDGRVEYTWHRDRKEMLRIGAYCLQDVSVEAEGDAFLMQHATRERRVWELDQTINDRGVRLDIALAVRAVQVVEAAKERLHTRMNEITEGAVPKCSQVAKLVAWINSRGVPCTSIAKGQQQELVAAASSDPVVLEALSLRQQAGKGTPTSKFQTMVDCACEEDDKARGQLFYHGASTGRWAGRLIQFQNLPGMDEERDGANVRAVLAVLRADHLTVEERVDAIAQICGTVLPMLSKSLRQMLMASPGCRFIGGDLSNIEGCVAAWLAGEDWKVDAYAEFQRTGNKNLDLYRVAYSRAFGVLAEAITGPQRQVGKVMELACGYQGAIGAFLGMCRNYNINPDTMVPAIRGATPEGVWEAARARYTHPGVKKFGLSEETWTALRVAVDLWRGSHPAIVGSWWELQDAAIDAVSNPGEVVEAMNGKVAYVYSRQVLWCKLPSGRHLAYHRPRVQTHKQEQLQDKDGKTAWVDDSDVVAYLKEGFTFTDAEPRYKKQVFFEGYDNTRSRWDENMALYGGLQFENIVQAIARDVMVEGMFAAETKGYPIVLTVHDELLCDVPNGHGSAAELKAIMSTVPHWCVGLPLAAKCWEDERYAK